MTGKRIEAILKAEGFQKTDAATKKRLIASGNWGMPNV